MVEWAYPTNPREASGLDPEAVHGGILGVFSGGILFPIWVNTAASGNLPFLLVPTPGVGFSLSIVFLAVSHLVYGAVLGGTYVALSRTVAVWPPRSLRTH